MPEYTVSFTIQGHAQKDSTTLNYFLGDTDIATANAFAAAMTTALGNVSDGTIKKVGINSVISEDGTIPGEGVNAFEEAVVSCYLNDVGEAEKLYTARIPAPIGELFLSDGQTLNTGNAALQAYVAQLAEALVSDGETIAVANNNGIAGGYKRSRARRFN